MGPPQVGGGQIGRHLGPHTRPQIGHTNQEIQNSYSICINIKQHYQGGVDMYKIYDCSTFSQLYKTNYLQKSRKKPIFVDPCKNTLRKFINVRMFQHCGMSERKKTRYDNSTIILVL